MKYSEIIFYLGNLGWNLAWVKLRQMNGDQGQKIENEDWFGSPY